MTWQAWRKKYPKSKVLSTRTGFARNYGRTPYASYHSSKDTMFPITTRRTELPAKTLVLGIIVNGTPKAYPLDTLESLQDTIAGQTIQIQYDKTSKHAAVHKSQSGQLIPSVTVYWFAWQAFYPNTKLHPSETN